MGVGDHAGGNVLRVDPDMLSQLGSQLQTSANALPAPPAPFSVTGGDAISAAIAAKLPALETPIIEGLPKVKAEASETAANIITSAANYLSTDEELAGRIEKGLFDGAGAPASDPSGGVDAPGGLASGASGSAGAGGDAAGQMEQMMSTPLQMASQAAQMPQQAMGALSGAMQGGMQGAQQITQMATGAGKGSEGSGGTPDEQASDSRAEQEAAAGGQHRSERAPLAEAPQSDSAVPDDTSSGPRHAAPDPSTNL